MNGFATPGSTPHQVLDRLAARPKLGNDELLHRLQPAQKKLRRRRRPVPTSWSWRIALPLPRPPGAGTKCARRCTRSTATSRAASSGGTDRVQRHRRRVPRLQVARPPLRIDKNQNYSSSSFQLCAHNGPQRPRPIRLAFATTHRRRSTTGGWGWPPPTTMQAPARSPNTRARRGLAPCCGQPHRRRRDVYRRGTCSGRAVTPA